MISLHYVSYLPPLLISYLLLLPLQYTYDSPLKRVDAFDYDFESGKIDNRRPVFRVDTGYPDGMTIDAEGITLAG